MVDVWLAVIVARAALGLRARTRGPVKATAVEDVPVLPKATARDVVTYLGHRRHRPVDVVALVVAPLYAEECNVGCVRKVPVAELELAQKLLTGEKRLVARRPVWWVGQPSRRLGCALGDWVGHGGLHQYSVDHAAAVQEVEPRNGRATIIVSELSRVRGR